MSTKTRTKSRAGTIYLEPDSLTVVVPALLGALIVGGVSFLMSWDALRVVGRWAGVASSRTWGLPVAVDASILLFTAFWLIARRRGLPVRFHVAAVTLFTLGSMGGNVAHALADGVGEGWQVAVGAIAAAAFPLTVFATTHAVAGLLVDPDADVRPARVRRRASRTAQVLPVPAATTVVSPSAALPPEAQATPGRAAARTATTTNRAGRADRDALRAQFEALVLGGASARGAGMQLGLSSSTAVRWAREVPRDAIPAGIAV